MLLNDCIKIMGSGMLLLVMLAQPILFSFSQGTPVVSGQV